MSKTKSMLPEVVEMFERARQLNISIVAMANIAGVHHSIVYRWKRGETSPTMFSFSKVNKVLNDAIQS